MNEKNKAIFLYARCVGSIFLPPGKRAFKVVLLISSLAFALTKTQAQEAFNLEVRSNGRQVELSWPARLTPSNGQSMLPLYEVQRSTDFVHWTPAPKALRGNGSCERLSMQFDTQGAPEFYRVLGNLAPVSMGNGGEEVFGYKAAMQEALSQLGPISAQEFTARFGRPDNYLPGLSWDSSQAQYWQAYDPQRSQTRLRLNTNEAAMLQKNGFVVSERLGAYSFAEGFYSVFTNDLPVFVSTDSILQAWNRTYLAMLEELEYLYLSDNLEKMLDGMAGQIPGAAQQYGSGVLKDSLRDADYFLAVARSLWAGKQVPSLLQQDAQVAQTLQGVSALITQPDFPMFGTVRDVDFSQFKARGNYEDNERLRRYFQTMMWCGRVDLRLGVSSVTAHSMRQLGTAIVLHDLLKSAGQFPRWRENDRVINLFVGQSDSMGFEQLGELLLAAGIRSPRDIASLEILQKLNQDLLAGNYGVQNIVGDIYHFPLGPSIASLPRSFTMFGQKFVVDSWALSQVVFPNIIVGNQKVNRRVPSSLDIAFSVLGNNDVVPDLYSRLTNPAGRAFRDGLPYQHNLAAVRMVIDRLSPASWDGNIYTGWLAALRELSSPTTGFEFPESMRTRAWAMKNLSTQLASWTHLRHATILYSKQSYTGIPICSYPYGFVEPRPAFWARMKKLAENTAVLLGKLSTHNVYVTTESFPGYYTMYTLDFIIAKQVSCANNFAQQVSTLQSIAEKELAQTPLSTNENNFLKTLIQNAPLGCTTTKYSGWYPSLFYMNALQYREPYSVPPPFDTGDGSDKWDPQVVDVHTDPPDDMHGDPGCVLHEAVGNANLLVIAIESGPDRMIYAGPVFSHYEFEKPAFVRMTDSEWKNQVYGNQQPPRPTWTQSYLVPGVSQVPDYIRNGY